MNKNSKIMAATGVSLVTALLMAFALSWIELKWGQSIYGFTFWFIIPVGALGCGVVASSGSYFASKALNLRPSNATRALALFTGVATFFLTHFFTFRAIPMPSAFQASNLMNFGEYLKLAMTDITYGKIGSDSGFRLGNLGYGLAALEIAGFAAGGILLQRNLTSQPWCSNCDLYVKKQSHTVNKYKDRPDYVEAKLAAFQLAKDGTAQEVMAALEAGKTNSKLAKHMLHGTLYQCPGCHLEHAIVEGQSKKGNRMETEGKSAVHPPATAAASASPIISG